MARNGIRQFPRTFEGDPKAFREAYEEAYPGFYTMDREELRREIAEWDREEYENGRDWVPGNLKRREAEAERGRRRAARDAELARRFESWQKPRLQNQLDMLKRYSSGSDEYVVAAWVSAQRFPRKEEKTTSFRRSNGYY